MEFQVLNFEKLYAEGHEEIVFFSDPTCSLKAIVAIHNTTLGPALGGTRMWDYGSFDEAVDDVLRLSKGMTYKAAVSNLNLGGGKGVILGDPSKVKSEALLRSYGRYLESLGGRYITAEDVNMTVEDIGHIFAETSYVTGVDMLQGGSGNPSPYTALGVFRGIEASCFWLYGERSVKGRHIALQGVGSVGRRLGKMLSEGGAKIFFCDIKKDNVERFLREVPGSEEVDLDEIYDVPCDIYSPCALGATVNDETIERLKCKIVAGAANNQLKEDRHGQILKDRGILYATDYLINAGGLMNVSIEFEGWSDEKARKMVDGIYKTTLDIFKISEKEGVPVYQATDILVERKIEAAKKFRNGIHINRTTSSLKDKRHRKRM